MNEREDKIRRWFSMWLKNDCTGIEEIFSADAVYTESWGPEYHGIDKIRHWFNEWNTRGAVLKWDITGFFHKENQTVTQWYFENKMDNGKVEAFEGMTLVQWTKDDKIECLKEFGCNINRYDPYEKGETPVFRDEKAAWF